MRKAIYGLLALLVLSDIAVGMEVNGELKKALLEKQSSDPTGYEARVYYNTTSKNPKIYNGTSWSTLGSGAGSGEKNYVSAGAISATGWVCVGDLDVATTTTAADLPREYTTASGIKITADSNVQSVADYCYFDFSLDDVDISKKLKIAWSQKTTGTYVAGDLAAVITTQADRTTALHTPITTAVPSADGVFTTSFDASTTATLSLVIRSTTDMATNGGIVISDVVVGPGTQPQGAVVGEWQTYTPTTTNFATAAAANRIGRWRRVGDSMQVRIRAEANGGGTGAYDFSMPSGHTIDTAKLSTTGVYGNLGTAAAFDFGVAFYSGTVVYGTTTTVTILDGDGSGAAADYWKTAQPFTWASGDIVTLDFTVPISEWSGSGTINLASNDVEYASVAGTWDADSSTTVHGLAGTTMGGALTAARAKTITWQTAIQTGDIISLLIDTGTGYQTVPTSTVPAHSVQNTTTYGASSRGPASATTSVIDFGQYRAPSGATFASAGSAWLNTYKWVAVKHKPGQAVGYGHVAQSSSGLVKSAGQLLGTNTNDVAATGFVGESVYSGVAAGSAVAQTTSTATTITSISLTAGDWDVSGSIVYLPAASTSITELSSVVSKTTNSVGSALVGQIVSGESRNTVTSVASVPGSGANVSVLTMPTRVSLSSTTSMFLVARPVFTVSTMTAHGSISARRVR